jgi:creatinine amidohydrolase
MSAGPESFERRTSADVGAAAGRLAVVPVGATEQHGPHLPLGTDTLLATAVAEAIVARSPNLMLGPVLALGCSGHHLAFPGTVSLRAPAFIATVNDVCRSLGAAGLDVVLLNAHGGNRAPLAVALGELAGEGVRAHALTYWELLADVAVAEFGDAAACGHACALETSLMLHLHPELVRRELIPQGGTPPAWPDPHMFSTDATQVVRPFDEINPDGVVGRPSLATVAAGERLFAEAVARCAVELDRIGEARRGDG